MENSIPSRLGNQYLVGSKVLTKSGRLGSRRGRMAGFPHAQAAFVEVQDASGVGSISDVMAGHPVLCRNNQTRLIASPKTVAERVEG